MLDGLTALVDLTASLRDGQLPHVVTGHRVVGTGCLCVQCAGVACRTIRRSRPAA